jgi:hypothetical protein
MPAEPPRGRRCPAHARSVDVEVRAALARLGPLSQRANRGLAGTQLAKHFLVGLVLRTQRLPLAGCLLGHPHAGELVVDFLETRLNLVLTRLEVLNGDRAHVSLPFFW